MDRRLPPQDAQKCRAPLRSPPLSPSTSRAACPHDPAGPGPSRRRRSRATPRGALIPPGVPGRQRACRGSARGFVGSFADGVCNKFCYPVCATPRGAAAALELSATGLWGLFCARGLPHICSMWWRLKPTLSLKDMSCSSRCSRPVETCSQTPPVVPLPPRSGVRARSPAAEAADASALRRAEHRAVRPGGGPGAGGGGGSLPRGLGPRERHLRSESRNRSGEAFGSGHASFDKLDNASSLARLSKHDACRKQF